MAAIPKPAPLQEQVMVARCQRFLQRVRGTQRLIFLLILGYDLYLYSQMLQHGLAGFVVSVVVLGISIGAMFAWLFAKSSDRLMFIAQASYYPVMAIYLLSQGARVHFPMWVYWVSHVLLWIGFTTYFWYASRPYDFEFAFSMDKEANDAPDGTTP